METFFLFFSILNSVCWFGLAIKPNSRECKEEKPTIKVSLCINKKRGFFHLGHFRWPPIGLLGCSIVGIAGNSIEHSA
jgi:hypothetical protein